MKFLLCDHRWSYKLDSILQWNRLLHRDGDWQEGIDLVAIIMRTILGLSSVGKHGQASEYDLIIGMYMNYLFE